MKKILIILGIIVGLVVLLIVFTPSSKESFEKGREAGKGAVENQDQKQFDNEIAVIANSLDGNLLNIQARDLKAKKNPKGEGVFVFHPETRFSGVERFILWLVIEEQAYPLNGATKDVTPELSWPREADDELWNKTGLDKYQAIDAIEIVFGK